MTWWLTSSFEVENKCFEFQKEFMIDTCLIESMGKFDSIKWMING